MQEEAKKLHTANHPSARRRLYQAEMSWSLGLVTAPRTISFENSLSNPSRIMSGVFSFGAAKMCVICVITAAPSRQQLYFRLVSEQFVLVYACGIGSPLGNYMSRC